MDGHAGNTVDIGALLLMALGLSTYPEAEIWGGVSLSLAAAFIASRFLASGMVKNAKPLGIFGTLAAGVFTGLMAALIAAHWLPEWPIQLVMGGAGFLSSFVLPLILKLAAQISNRSDAIADRALDRVLPDDPQD